MTTNVINQMPYLRTSRSFPEEDLLQLAVESNRSYIDIADKVNNRIIGLHPTTKPAINGEAWFIKKNQKQQGFRQVYVVPAGIVNGSTIETGFKFEIISQFSTKCYGVFTDGTNWYGMIFASRVAIAGQISFWLQVNGASTKSDNIVFAVGAGAPALVSGTIVLEWLSDV
jgi:hypothetical protein